MGDMGDFIDLIKIGGSVDIQRTDGTVFFLLTPAFHLKNRSMTSITMPYSAKLSWVLVIDVAIPYPRSHVCRILNT